jgi:MSHA pilin protein MshA
MDSACRSLFFDHGKSLRAYGFTLIELIVMVTMVGFLAATAVPRYVDLNIEAANTTAKGVAGAIESASTLNHALDLAVEANLTPTSIDTFYTISNCIHGAKLLSHALLPKGYAIASAAIADKESQSCVLIGEGGATANFVLIGAALGTDVTSDP